MRRARSLAQTVTGSMTQCFSVDWNKWVYPEITVVIRPKCPCCVRPSSVVLQFAQFVPRLASHPQLPCSRRPLPPLRSAPRSPSRHALHHPLPLLPHLPLCSLALRKNARVGMEQCVQAEPMNGKVAVSDTLRPYAPPPPWTNVYGHRSACVCVSMM